MRALSSTREASTRTRQLARFTWAGSGKDPDAPVRRHRVALRGALRRVLWEGAGGGREDAVGTIASKR